MIDRTLATKERPLLNQGVPYVSEAGRTEEDDVALVYDVGAQLRGRTHITEPIFNHIFYSTMRFFTEQEKYAFRAYQTGEKKKEEFYRDCAGYLKKNFPKEMSNDNDFNVMMDRINLAMFGYDVLQPLIDNPETSDIKICGPYDIRVRVKGKAYKSSATFADAHDLARFIEGLSYRNRVDIYGQNIITFTDRHDENYILRFVVSSPNVNAVDYPYLHIRKVPKIKPDWNKLIAAGMLNEDVKRYLIDRAKLSRGIVFAGPPGCVDRETEFFNGKEWKSIADWDNEKVLQFDPKTNEATLVEPLRYIKEPCNMMYHFETPRGINQTLSPEHRVLYYTRNSAKKSYSAPKEISAEEMYQLQCQGKFNGYIKTDFIYNGQGLPLTDIELKLMLAVICDGTFPKHHSDNTNYCSIRLKKKRKKMALEEILKDGNIDYHKLDEADGYTRYSFQAPRKEKSFTSDWYQCSAQQLELICDNILQWDGSYGKCGYRTFTTTIKETADFVQFAFSACGQRATISVKDRSGELYKTNGKKYIRRSAEYTLCISKHNMISMIWDHRSEKKPIPTEVTPSDGYRYCFTVPTHALVLRRNGRIFTTRNSGKTTALNAFIEDIPKTRETLVIQENDELHTEQSGFMFKHVAHGFHGEPECSLEDLARMALVEGCNEFVIGEVKGGEMRYVMTLLNAGGYAALTVHSTNAYETLDKLADLVKYGSSYSFDEARRMLKTFDTIVYMEGYKIREILEVDGFDDKTKQFKYVNIYRYDGENES